MSHYDQREMRHNIQSESPRVEGSGTRPDIYSDAPALPETMRLIERLQGVLNQARDQRDLLNGVASRMLGTTPEEDMSKNGAMPEGAMGQMDELISLISDEQYAIGVIIARLERL